MADADYSRELVDILYRQNKRTKKLHRIAKMPNGQILSGEKCNLDQALNLREVGSDALEGLDRCEYCFG